MLRYLIPLCAALALVPGQLFAQTYPERRITVLTSFGPGGGTDFLARIVGQKLGERWSQPVAVESRMGGNGIIGARAAAKSNPDGYTLYVGSSNHMVLLPAMYDNLPFDPLKDFIPVIPIGSQPIVLALHPSVPASSVADFVALAKYRPGQLNYAVVGIGSLEHLVGTLFEARTGTQLVYVPYKSSGDAVAALLGGQGVSMMFASSVSVAPHVKTGRLKAIVSTAPKRSSALPDVPTGAESGLSDFVAFTWNGMFAPAGTPPEVVTKLHAELVNILSMPDVVQRLSAAGVEPMGGTMGAFSALIGSEIQRWRQVLKDSRIEVPKLN